MFGSKSNQQKMQIVDNPIEAGRSIATGTVDSLVNDVIGKGSADFFRQLVGAEQKSESFHAKGDLYPGVELDVTAISKKTEQKPHIESGIDYHRELLQGTEKVRRQEQFALKDKLNQIIAELQRLEKSSQVIEMKVQTISVVQGITPSKYHENFLEWLFSVIQAARIQVEDSGAWLATLSSKKGGKGYWNQFKSQGTSFSQNNERSVATSVG